MTTTRDGSLYLGTEVGAHGEPTGAQLAYEAANLTTHGVIVGMTGSGKTGLGVVLVEEALLEGIPTLVIDPKGDMGNLLLSFPEFAPADFEPWVDATAAERDGVSVGDLAAATAEKWRSGLAGSGIGAERLTELNERADFAIYTPGSRSGIPLNLIGSMAAPGSGVDAETLADEIDGFASSVLGLVGIDADPLASREHILISNIIADAWSNGNDIDLPGLIGQIQQPPMRKLGVIDLDTFYPPADRTALAMKLNGLVASPAFASWMEGVPVDIERLLYTESGGPRCSVISIADLSDEERQFVVTLLLSKLITWMRTQPGTTDLRALVYMDEVFGFVPPSAAPPAKKPILTILKQARAFGVGMVLSTQNPVDLDYKAISNAGTWMIGRLQTERDKARLLEGMTSASGGIDTSTLDTTIGELDKRQFLLHSTALDGPVVFGTRWAMSYLPGPLTREQIASLTDPHRERLMAASGGAAGTARPMPERDESSDGSVAETAREQLADQAGSAHAGEAADDESLTLPKVAPGRRVSYLDVAAPWASRVGAKPGGTRLEPALLARVKLLYDDTAADLRHEVDWESVFHPLSGDSIYLEDRIEVDYDDRDLRDDPPEGARDVLTGARIDTKTYFTRAEKALKDSLYRNETLTLFANATRVPSSVDESGEDFKRRCLDVAEDRADDQADKVRAALEKKVDRIKDAVVKAQDKVREVEADASSRGKDAMLSGALDVLGGLLGGRKRTRSILGGVRRAGGKGRQKQKAEERLRTAENRLAEKVDELEDLEVEIIETLEDIQDDWDEKAALIESVEVPLEKTDISIGELSLVWIPT